MENEEHPELSPEARSRVERGVALLDSHLGPDWPLRVDRTRLDINDPSDCVLGQLFHEPGASVNGYGLGVRTLWPLVTEVCCPSCSREPLARSHGFMSGSGVRSAGLTAAWRAQVGVLQDERQPDWA